MEYNKLGETDPSTDMEVDAYQQELAKNEDDFIIEGRTSWHFIPRSVKIYLDVDEKEGARRVFEELKKEHSRNEGSELHTAEDVLKSHQERKKSDKIRYAKYYSIDVYEINNYDLVIDTTGLPIDKVYEKVEQYINNLSNIK